jgi:hypothetical protein
VCVPRLIYNKEVNCACVGDIITIINENARNITHKKIATSFDSHVKCPIYLSDFNQIWLFRWILVKGSSVKFHENLSGGDRKTHAHVEADKRFLIKKKK